MTLQQLEYILAVDAYKQFSTAAEKCFITQPSLSAMIQKLEEELGVKIFDRSKQPILPTELGAEIIAQARLMRPPSPTSDLSEPAPQALPLSLLRSLPRWLMRLRLRRSVAV